MIVMQEQRAASATSWLSGQSSSCWRRSRWSGAIMRQDDLRLDPFQQLAAERREPPPREIALK